MKDRLLPNQAVEPSPLDDGGLDMAEELRSVLRWEEHRMGAVSKGVLKSVIARIEAIQERAR